MSVIKTDDSDIRRIVVRARVRDEEPVSTPGGAQSIHGASIVAEWFIDPHTGASRLVNLEVRGAGDRLVIENIDSAPQWVRQFVSDHCPSVK